MINFIKVISLKNINRYNTFERENIMIEINIKDFGTIAIELDYNNAPNTCANFVSLARSGFYNGLTFHRIIKGFMIQGGCPLGTGTGNPGYSIKGEFAQNGVKNTLTHESGVISMARSSMPNSAGSQFFIMHKNAPHLDGAYASFGKVIKGMEIVDQIANQKTGPSDRPVAPVIITSIVVIDEPENKVMKA